MRSDEMKHIFSLLFKAKNEKNSSFVADYLADEIIWHECDQNGEDLIVTWSKEKFLKGNFFGGGPFDTRTNTIIFQIAENDMLAAYFIIEGIHVNNFFGYSATGKNVRFYATYTVKFKNGLIAEIWAIADGLLALKQIGAIK